MKICGCLLLTLFLISCASAPQGEWYKPNSTDEEFSKIRYVCLQQSQQPYSSSWLDTVKGGSSSYVATNDGLFSACMNANGFYWQATAK